MVDNTKKLCIRVILAGEGIQVSDSLDVSSLTSQSSPITSPGANMMNKMSTTTSVMKNTPCTIGKGNEHITSNMLDYSSTPVNNLTATPGTFQTSTQITSPSVTSNGSNAVKPPTNVFINVPDQIFQSQENTEEGSSQFPVEVKDVTRIPLPGDKLTNVRDKFQSDSETDEESSQFHGQYCPPSTEVVDVTKIPLPEDGTSDGTV